MSDRLQVEIVDPEGIFTLEEVCERLPLDADFVISCVEYGIADAQGESTPESWCFSFTSVRRLQKARRLQRDLEMDFSGLSVVLELLEDMEQMRRQVEVLEKRLRHWEGE